MKLNDLLNANDALKTLTGKRFTSYKKARLLVKLRKAVETEIEFYTEEERKAIKTYAELNEKGNPVFLPDGRLRLKDEQAKTAFESEIAKLRDSDVDGIEMVTLSENDFISADELPTPEEMLLLESLVEFTD